MDSKNPSRFYDDTTLKVLEQAFREVWKVMHMRDGGQHHGEILREKITHNLLHLVDQGITDPDDLRAVILSRLEN